MSIIRSVIVGLICGTVFGLWGAMYHYPMTSLVLAVLTSLSINFGLNLLEGEKNESRS